LTCTASTHIDTLSLHDALPISYVQDKSIDKLRYQQEQTEAEIKKILREQPSWSGELPDVVVVESLARHAQHEAEVGLRAAQQASDRKSTRLNSSHRTISYAVFC